MDWSLEKIVSYIIVFEEKHHNTKMVFDRSEPTIDEELFEKQDWSNYVYATDDTVLKEALTGNMPEPQGKGVLMSACIDADHTGESVTRRSRNSFLIYLNSSLIYCQSKKQTSVETSIFGSEFMAMKHCTKYIRGL